MSGRTILAVLLTASLAGNAAFLLTAFAKAPPRGAIDQLALTPEQAARFEASRGTFQDERRLAHRRLAELRLVLAEEFAREAPDPERLVTTAVGMAQVQTEMRPKLVDHLLVLHRLLTPAQRTTFANLMRVGGGSAMCPATVLYAGPDGAEQP